MSSVLWWKKQTLTCGKDKKASTRNLLKLDISLVLLNLVTKCKDEIQNSHVLPLQSKVIFLNCQFRLYCYLLLEDNVICKRKGCKWGHWTYIYMYIIISRMWVNNPRETQILAWLFGWHVLLMIREPQLHR